MLVGLVTAAKDVQAARLIQERVPSLSKLAMKGVEHCIGGGAVIPNYCFGCGR